MILIVEYKSYVVDEFDNIVVIFVQERRLLLRS